MIKLFIRRWLGWFFFLLKLKTTNYVQFFDLLLFECHIRQNDSIVWHLVLQAFKGNFDQHSSGERFFSFKWRNTVFNILCSHKLKSIISIDARAKKVISAFPKILKFQLEIAKVLPQVKSFSLISFQSEFAAKFLIWFEFPALKIDDDFCFIHFLYFWTALIKSFWHEKSSHWRQWW